MSAFVCDRCGVEQGTAPIIIRIDDRLIDGRLIATALDLCSRCEDSLDEWWGEPTRTERQEGGP